MKSLPREQRTVSRKTPADGKVEITRPFAEALMSAGSEFELETPEGHGTVVLASMPCTCRGKNHPHVHWFLESMQFRALVPGSEIELTLHGRRIVVTNR